MGEVWESREGMGGRGDGNEARRGVGVLQLSSAAREVEPWASLPFTPQLR